MITALLVFKEKLMSFYAKAGIYINYALKFIMAFLAFLLIGRFIGTNELLASPIICFAAGLLCAFVPINATVLCATLLTIIHLFGMSIELALVATIVMLIVYLLYFRFAPKTGFLMIITPLLFCIKLPYVVPVIAALTVGITGIIPVICGSFIYYLINFAHNYSTAISTLDADSALQNITFIFNNVLNNKELIIIVISFSIAIMMIYMIRRMSVNYSWIIGIVVGCVTDAIVIIVSFSLLMVDFSVGGLIGGTLVAILIGMIMHLFVFSVDYSSTEYVQFEDNDYYYYVKAVPKVSVSGRNVTIKKINSLQEEKGFVHTESYEDEMMEVEEQDQE